MPPPSKEALRQTLRDNLDATIGTLNAALRGQGVEDLVAVLARLGRGGTLPHWYVGLRESGTLPNLDGKTIGSVLEMLLVAILQIRTFAGIADVPSLRINPARGIDLPDLDLGIKSPSENYCTSEPFFSAYERLIGGEYDALVLLTDYQAAKRSPPLRLQILRWRYLRKSQLADDGLCRIARRHRERLLADNEARAKKVCRFLAYVNQSDWRAKRLLGLLAVLDDEQAIRREIGGAAASFALVNQRRERTGLPPLPETELAAITAILGVQPLTLGAIEAADNWVLDSQKDFGRAPNDNEWERFVHGPLDGAIGMSFALQWRFNFGRVFGVAVPEPEAG